MPVRRPFSVTNALGERLMTIWTLSSSASSSSHTEALKKPRGLRAMTLTLSAPSRRLVRQQSMAVLPTPMMSTRLPILSMWPKATDSSQAMPMCTLAAAASRPGSFSSLPLGAPEPTNTASNPCPSSARMLGTGELRRRSTPMPVIMAISSFSTVCGRRNEGMLVRIRPPGSPYCSNMVTS